MLPAGRLSHKLVRHEPDVTETAPGDGKCFFIFPLPDWNNPAIIVVVVLLARCKSEAVHVQSQEVQHFLRRLKGKWTGVMLQWKRNDVEQPDESLVHLVSIYEGNAYEHHNHQFPHVLLFISHLSYTSSHIMKSLADSSSVLLWLQWTLMEI